MTLIASLDGVAPEIDQREKAFGKLNCQLDHQNGSHMILRQNFPPFRRLTVPHHREISKGTLRSLIREAGLSVEGFVGLL